jgi:hypothetical protein
MNNDLEGFIERITIQIEQAINVGLKEIDNS